MHRTKNESNMPSIVEITSVATGGHGVGRINGQVCFVPYALPGDTIRTHELRKRKGVLWGEIAEVLAPSQHRAQTDCPVFGTCGGCS